MFQLRGHFAGKGRGQARKRFDVAEIGLSKVAFQAGFMVLEGVEFQLREL
jgi:hypothetical protein